VVWVEKMTTVEALETRERLWGQEEESVVNKMREKRLRASVGSRI
jgi:hypothetical protein